MSEYTEGQFAAAQRLLDVLRDEEDWPAAFADGEHPAVNVRVPRERSHSILYEAVEENCAMQFTMTMNDANRVTIFVGESE